ncbi:MAG: hypothetical protein U0031_17205 [Thermomicrobiales bacterium]
MNNLELETMIRAKERALLDRNLEKTRLANEAASPPVNPMSVAIAAAGRIQHLLAAMNSREGRSTPSRRIGPTSGQVVPCGQPPL